MRTITMIKYILLVFVVGLFGAAITLKLYDPDVINYRIDTLRSQYYAVQHKDEDVIPLGESVDKSYVSPFQKLPKNYLYTGHALLYFNTDEGLSVNEFCEQSFNYTRYFTVNDYKKHFIAVNNLKDNTLPLKSFLIIPGLADPVVFNLEKNEKPPMPFARTLYYSGKSICSNQILQQIIASKKVGVTAVVFDVKDIPGYISYKSSVPEVIELNTHKYRHTDDMKKIVRYLKANGIYVIARVACFRDNMVLKKRPNWAIRSAKTGNVWVGAGEKWLDPTNKHVQDYTIKVAVEAARLGVDEVQFDYIRFPTGGDLKDAVYAHSYGKMAKEDTIANFLKRANQELKKENVYVSIDIFGVVAWGNNIDIRHTGQRISKLAPHCDIICPMLYPSHFNNNFRGYAKPADNPYYFIAEGVKRVAEQAGEGTHIRPWLQAFAWRVTHYNSSYIKKQIKASIDTQAEGYLFWNAKNEYKTVLRALSELDDLEK